MVDLPLKCDCGAFRARLTDITPARVNRVKCYCSDCQAFAHYLDHIDGTLDENGGTDIFQTSPMRLEILEGREHLRCVKLNENGVLRWYTGCCNSPIGNTAGSPALTFIGVIHSIVDWQAAGRLPDELLGPIKGAVWQQEANGEQEHLMKGVGTIGLLWGALKVIVPAYFGGARKNNALFEPESGKPVASPNILTAEDRERLPPYQQA